MRTRTGWLVGILTAGIALAPRPGWGQEVPPADPAIPLPLYHDRPEKGGFYTAGEFIFWRQTNPLKPQMVAVRGLVDTDGSLQTARNMFFPFVRDPITGIIITIPAVDPNTGAPLRVPLRNEEPVPGRFFGSGATALNTEQLAGPVSYEPGFGVTLGWRFADCFTLEFNWRHLAQVRYNAVASVVPPNFRIGRNGEDQYLFSPVHNFPPEFAGPVFKLSVTEARPIASQGVVTVTPVNSIVDVGPGLGLVPIPFDFAVSSFTSTITVAQVPQAAYGIWNAATIMSIDFVQRYDEFELVGRMPLYQNDCTRWYGVCGLRHVAMWERFKWRTVSVSTVNAGQTAAITLATPLTNQNPSPDDANSTPATFNGATINVGTQFVTSAPATAGADDVAVYTNIVSNRLYGPMIGCGSEWYLGWGLSVSLDLRAALHVDVVKERARYEREDKYIAHKRSRTEYVLVPELDAHANLWWYPIEGVEMRFGYDILNFFNTVSSPRPVDFNYGAVAPAWEKGTYRFIEGFHAGVGLIF